MINKEKYFLSFVLVLLLLVLITIIIFSISNIHISSEVQEALINQEVSISNTEFDVSIQDQTTKPFDIQVNRVLNYSYSLASTPVVDTYNLTLVNASGLTQGDKITFLSENGVPEIFFGYITAVNGNVITLNVPVPFAFVPSKTTVLVFDNFLNVDGSSSPIVFSLDNFFDTSVDITRFIFKCTGDVEMHDGLFCNIDQLNRGILVRKKTINGDYINYFNVRNNAKWSLLAYDTHYTDSGKPPDDTYGFSSRLTYAGNNKHGVAIRLESGESIELLVQDDLRSIGSASFMVEGHFTEGE